MQRLYFVNQKFDYCYLKLKFDRGQLPSQEFQSRDSTCKCTRNNWGSVATGMAKSQVERNIAESSRTNTVKCCLFKVQAGKWLTGESVVIRRFLRIVRSHQPTRQTVLRNKSASKRMGLMVNASNVVNYGWDHVLLPAIPCLADILPVAHKHKQLSIPRPAEAAVVLVFGLVGVAGRSRFDVGARIDFIDLKFLSRNLLREHETLAIRMPGEIGKCRFSVAANV